MVLRLWAEVRQQKEDGDYARYYQQWSDVCMLRLFSTFMQSAPQLVFQLYALIQQQQQRLSPGAETTAAEQPPPSFNTTWTMISVAASTVSLGWGVAAYCHALRLAASGGEKRR